MEKKNRNVVLDRLCVLALEWCESAKAPRGSSVLKMASEKKSQIGDIVACTKVME